MIQTLAVAQTVGFEIDVVHEPDDVYLVLRVRLPKKSGVPALVEMLTNRAGSGFYRSVSDVPKD